jgi:diguanylate cyclase (GGDEF)-like protein
VRVVTLRRAAALSGLTLVVVLGLLWLLGSSVATGRPTASDARLFADLQLARSTVALDVAEAGKRAFRLAREERTRAVLAGGEAGALQALAASHPGTELVTASGRRAGSLPPLAVTQVAEVVSGGRAIGRVVTAAAIDASFLERVQADLPTASNDFFAVLENGAVAVGPLPAGTRISAPAAGTVRVSGHDYRALDAQLVPERRDLRIAALSARSKSFMRAWRVPLAVTAALTALGLLGAWVFALIRPEQTGKLAPADPAPEQKEVDGVALLGETLAATHDAEALLRAILDAAVKATGAAGGRIARPGDAVSRLGESGNELLRIPLDSDHPAGGSALLLYPPPTGFTANAAEVASWLGVQATTAIKNSRFHRVVQEQDVRDELTGLANRRRFTTALHQEFQAAEVAAAPLAVLLGDLDGFKQVNARLGQRAGDEALKGFAGTLLRCAREIDLPARIGGDEFAVVLPRTDAEGARLFADRLRAELRADLSVPDFVTASFGIACYPDAGSAEELLIDADRSLQGAKEGGKDRVVVADGQAATR